MRRLLKQLLNPAYSAFNRRDIDGVLQCMSDDVEWANGWEGGFVHGHAQVRDYWTVNGPNSTRMLRPFPFMLQPDHKTDVLVHQCGQRPQQSTDFRWQGHSPLYTEEWPDGKNGNPDEQ